MLNKVYVQANSSSGASGPAAATTFAASGSASAGSNALTTPVRFTPSSQVLSQPSNAITAGIGAAPTTATTLTSSSNGANALPLTLFTRFARKSSPLSLNPPRQFPVVT